MDRREFLVGSAALPLVLAIPFTPKAQAQPENTLKTEWEMCADDFWRYYEKSLRVGGEPLILNEFQRRASWEFLTGRDYISIAGRRRGKTVLLSALALWYATFNPNFRVNMYANAAPWHTMQLVYEMVHTAKIRHDVEMLHTSNEYQSFRFINGSVIQATASMKRSRGVRSDVALVDEAWNRCWSDVECIRPNAGKLLSLSS